MKQILFFLIFLLLPFVVADLEGKSNVVDGYKIELATEPEIIKVGRNTILSIALENASTEEPITDYDLWLRISKASTVLFSSPNFYGNKEGPIVISYNFLSGGEHEVDININLNNEEIKTTFDVNVEGSKKLDLNMILLIITFIVGLLIGIYVKKRK